MAVGRAISLFLIDGMPDGRVACELFNWTGKAFRIPRKLVKDSADRVDLRRAGVYFLFGRDDARNEVNSVYVGEADRWPSPASDEVVSRSEGIPVQNTSAKVPGPGAGGHGQASTVGNLTGMTRAEVDATLIAQGATKHVTAGGYIHYRFPDGSQVFIRPDGRVGRVAAPRYDPVTGQRTNRGQRLDQDGQPTTSHDSGDRVLD